MRRLNNLLESLIPAIVAVLIIGLVLAALTSSIWTQRSVSGTVTDEYIKRYDDSDHFFVVVRLEDGSEEIYENTDNLFFLKVNSADVQVDIRHAVETESHCDFLISGFRFPLLSWFPNVISMTCDQ